MEAYNYEIALKLYYTKSELQNADIGLIFGLKASTAINRRKKKVRQKMAETDCPIYTAYGVNTRIAYEVWGIDIELCEQMYKKYKRLKLDI